MLTSSISLFLGLRYTLARQRSRSVAFISRVAMTGIVLGVALLILVLSVMNGFDKELRERILRIMPEASLYHGQGISDWQSLRRQLLEHDDIIAVSPFVELQGMVNVRKKTEPVLVYGIDRELESTTSILHEFLSEDTLLQLSTNDQSIILGGDLAEKLNVTKGDRVSLIIPRAEGQQRAAAIQRLVVLDVLNTGTEVDASLAVMGIQSAASLSTYPDAISGLRLKTRDLFLAHQVSRDIQLSLPYGFYTSDWTRTHGNIYYAIQMSKNLVSLLLLLIIAIAAFNVVSTLVMVVIDKQSDIAILSTLGATKRQILAIFMVQGTVISLIGTAVGVVLGVLLALSIQDIVVSIESLLNVSFLKSDIYPISYLPSHILWSDVVMVVLVSIMMSFFATLYPAWRASRIKPAEVLRYDV